MDDDVPDTGGPELDNSMLSTQAIAGVSPPPQSLTPLNATKYATNSASGSPARLSANSASPRPMFKLFPHSNGAQGTTTDDTGPRVSSTSREMPSPHQKENAAAVHSTTQQLNAVTSQRQPAGSTGSSEPGPTPAEAAAAAATVQLQQQQAAVAEARARAEQLLQRYSVSQSAEAAAAHAATVAQAGAAGTAPTTAAPLREGMDGDDTAALLAELRQAAALTSSSSSSAAASPSTPRAAAAGAAATDADAVYASAPAAAAAAAAASAAAAAGSSGPPATDGGAMDALLLPPPPIVRSSGRARSSSDSVSSGSEPAQERRADWSTERHQEQYQSSQPSWDQESEDGRGFGGDRGDTPQQVDLGREMDELVMEQARLAAMLARAGLSDDAPAPQERSWEQASASADEEDQASARDRAAAAEESEGSAHGGADYRQGGRGGSGAQAEDFNFPFGPQEGAVNEALLRHGFDAVSLLNPLELMATLQDVLLQYEERGRAIERQALGARRGEGGGGGAAAGELEGRVEDLTRALRAAASEERTKLAHRELDTAKSAAAAEARAHEATKQGLLKQLKASEARVTAKEVLAERLIARLAAQAERESSQRRTDKDMLSKMRASVGSASTRGGGGGGGDARVAEVVRAYERARQKDGVEMDHLRCEVARLAEELRLAENRSVFAGPDVEIAARSARRAAEAEDFAAETARELSAAREVHMRLERRLARAQEELAQQRSAREQRRLAQQPSAQERAESRLQNLELDVQSRPTVKEWRECQYRVKELEQQLAKAVADVEEAYDIRRLRRHTDTRELMRRDRADARLGLSAAIAAVPLEAAREALRDACRRLSVSDIGEIGGAIDKLARVVAVVPRLAGVVNGVCAALFGEEGDAGGRALEDIPDIVETLLNFKGAVLSELADRAVCEPPPLGRNVPPPKNDHAAVLALKQLVDLERRVAVEHLEKRRGTRDAQRQQQQQQRAPLGGHGA
ncbi:hypothetical protein JKP88DRAFT_351349 [Tribonema minus]|uniref:Centrosomal protein of 70 kDa n=1 Tax=Tribonema minus TaxID=303371 RepID=A0A835YIJ6_9STRA|nr:hypothetical protein JKP88DRAFT_351349 [Tribonema minus]